MICTSIAALSFDDTKALVKKCVMAEIRLDLLDFTEQEMKELFGQTETPLIATYRPGKISEDERLALFKRLINYGTQYIDIEIEALPLFKSEVVAAAKGKTEVIISYHNYEQTPSRFELETIVTKCYNEGADIAKIACQVNSSKDAARIMGLYAHFEDVVAIGMGEKGKITRIAAEALGSPFTFASVDDENKTAPGQLSERELKTVYEVLNTTSRS